MFSTGPSFYHTINERTMCHLRNTRWQQCLTEDILSWSFLSHDTENAFAAGQHTKEIPELICVFSHTFYFAKLIKPRQLSLKGFNAGLAVRQGLRTQGLLAGH